MNIYERIVSYDLPNEPFTQADVYAVLQNESVDERGLRVLLSDAAATCLEDMARRAMDETRRMFGGGVVLYTPLYLANHCINGCLYCGFSIHNDIARGQLSYQEVEREAAAIAADGFQQIIVLTGESESDTPLEYIAECVRVIRKHIPNIACEIYPLDTDGYAQLIDAGANGLTIYQETYNKPQYLHLHPSGPKRDYDYRFRAPERACMAGMRNVNIGALLGLYDWRSEVYYTALHAAYLSHMYPSTDVAVSVPRMSPAAGGFTIPSPVNDTQLVQACLALRIFLPHVGITLSTRESASLRDNLTPLCITRISAGSITSVGGHCGDATADAQFDISDARSLLEMCTALRGLGMQPILRYDY